MAFPTVKQLGMSKRIHHPFSSFSALVARRSPVAVELEMIKFTQAQTRCAGIAVVRNYRLCAGRMVCEGHDAGIVYMGMAAIFVGNGLFKAMRLPCCLPVTRRTIASRRRITMYYMSVNIGSFFSMLATPWLAALWLGYVLRLASRRYADNRR